MDWWGIVLRTMSRPVGLLSLCKDNQTNQPTNQTIHTPSRPIPGAEIPTISITCEWSLDGEGTQYPYTGPRPIKPTGITGRCYVASMAYCGIWVRRDIQLDGVIQSIWMDILLEF